MSQISELSIVNGTNGSNAVMNNLSNLPKLPKSTFAERRHAFMKQMGKGAAIFHSAPESIRSNDTHYRYRQDSDLYYLTGFTEPETVCLLLPEHPEHKFVLFVRPRNPERETWDGRRFGPEGAINEFGADAAYSIEELDTHLPKYLENVDLIHYSLGLDSQFDKRIIDLIKRYRYLRQRNGAGPYGILDPGIILQEMRIFKTEDEVVLMRQAANIAAEAHKNAMRAVHPGMFEFEIESIIEQHFRRSGALAPAYNSIVGTGANGTILHYIENNAQLKDGDLLLVDAGAEYEYYCSDITRTFPVNGKFSAAQAEIYQIVLNAQLKAIEMVRPGTKFTDVHQAALDVIIDGLIGLGLLPDDREKVVKETLYQKFFMHRTSHWLGIDVHDVGNYRGSDDARLLSPGMVLTVEPGIYIGELPEVPIQYHNIGIRIEDDLLVTETGYEVLTVNVPKSIEDLEALIGGQA